MSLVVTVRVGYMPVTKKLDPGPNFTVVFGPPLKCLDPPRSKYLELRTKYYNARVP